ncbi:MAG: hypothetical protein MR461_00820, partial [Prevotella sp.]|nr:hypothetical protein [Prevotella sp.]
HAATNLQGVQLSQLHQQSKRHSCTRLVHFLLWQAAKPSGDKCPLEDAPKNPFNPINPLLILRTRTIINPWENIAACVILTTDLSD